MASRTVWLADTLQAVWWAGATPPPFPVQLLGALARPLGPLYGVLARAAAHRSRARAPTRLPVPVLVVGNIVVGGAGKTPTVIALLQALQQAGHRPLVVSRGHGRRSTGPQVVQAHSRPDEVGDEPLLIARRSGLPVVVSESRLDAARHGLHQYPDTTVVVSDDGLQHLKLPRDVEVLLFDERGTGNGRLLPAGPLREPLPAHDLTRVTDPPGVPRPVRFVLYNATAPSTPLPGALAERRVTHALPLTAWRDGAAGAAVPLQHWQGRTVDAAAGIAAPPRFFRALQAQGLTVRPWPRPDHDPWTDLPWPADADPVFVTEKDAVKLAARAGTLPGVWVVPLDFTLPPLWAQQVVAAVDASRPAPSDRSPAALAGSAP